MSYNSKNFSVMAYANGFTLWGYSSTDSLATIQTANYFDETAPFVRAGDMILITAGVGSETVSSAIMSVAKIANDNVTVASLIGSASGA